MHLLSEYSLAVPIIITTERRSVDELSAALDAGASDVLVKPFGPQRLASAIARALRLASAQRERDALREQVDRQAQEFNTLHTVGKTMHSLLNIDEILTLLVTAAVNLTNAEQSSLVLQDPATDELVLRGQYNLSAKMAQRMRVKVTDTVIERVIQSRRPILLSGNDLLTAQTSPQVNAILGVPLTVGDKVSGVLTVDNQRSPRAFGKHEVHVQTKLADLAATAIEKARLFAAAEQERDRLELLNSPDDSPQTFRSTAQQQATRVGDFPALWYARMVGGSSNHFTANVWRFHELDFRERNLVGAIPGTSFADWPIDYAELDPYYTKVEWEVGVSGLAGASPFDPPRSKPYPMPPLPVKSSGVLLERGARKLGLHPFPAPIAIASVPYRGRPSCAHCGFCIGFGSEMQAKSSTLYTMIPEAEATGRCEVRSESYVFRIETNERNRETGVRYFDRDPSRYSTL